MSERERSTDVTADRPSDATVTDRGGRSTGREGDRRAATGWRSPLATLRRVPGFVAKTVERIVVTRRLERRLRERPDHPAANREAAIAAVADADRILFLCWGNICRSPLAGRYLGARLSRAGVDDVTVESAGLGESEGRASPETAVEAAADHGVDLSGHRSARATREQVEASDAIFVMDHYNYYLLVTRYPEAAGRTFFLGALAGGTDARSTVIPDPHGEGRAAFDAAYATIVETVDRMVELMRSGKGGDRSETATDPSVTSEDRSRDAPTSEPLE